MTDLRWDHTVQYVNHLDRVNEEFAKYGLVAKEGGSHSEWGTYNTLSYFGLSYLEFLAIEYEDRLRCSAVVNHVCQDILYHLPEHEVLSRVALRTNNIEKIYAELRQQDLWLSDILLGKRQDAQGRLIEWRMFTIGGTFAELPYPFIIQWGDNDVQRLQMLKQNQIDVPHPAGKVQVESALFQVREPQQVVERWQTLFSLEKNSELPSSLNINGQQFIFNHGDENRLIAINFKTDSPDLDGKVIKVGAGEYRFSH